MKIHATEGDQVTVIFFDKPSHRVVWELPAPEHSTKFADIFNMNDEYCVRMYPISCAHRGNDLTVHDFMPGGRGLLTKGYEDMDLLVNKIPRDISRLLTPIGVAWIGTDDGNSVVGTVYKWMNGGTLEDDMSLEHLVTVAKTLEEYHARGWVHCDVKPSNILIHDGVAYLADLDLSERMGDISNGNGTSHYRSILSLAKKTNSGYVDWWAFANMLGEIILGRDILPDEEEDIHAYLREVVHIINDSDTPEIIRDILSNKIPEGSMSGALLRLISEVSDSNERENADSETEERCEHVSVFSTEECSGNEEEIDGDRDD